MKQKRQQQNDDESQWRKRMHIQKDACIDTGENERMKKEEIAMQFFLLHSL